MKTDEAVVAHVPREEAVSVSSMDQYKTRSRANIARRVHLFDPATGKKTDDWLDVLSSLSDKFRAARDLAYQEAGEVAAIENKDVKARTIAESQLRMKAALVTGWSFPTKCSEENVVDFLREAPQIQALVVQEADDVVSFFSNPSAG